MSGPRPRGIFDDAPVIGPGAPQAAAAGIFDDAPVLPAATAAAAAPGLEELELPSFSDAPDPAEAPGVDRSAELGAPPGPAPAPTAAARPRPPAALVGPPPAAVPLPAMQPAEATYVAPEALQAQATNPLAEVGRVGKQLVVDPIVSGARGLVELTLAAPGHYPAGYEAPDTPEQREDVGNALGFMVAAPAGIAAQRAIAPLASRLSSPVAQGIVEHGVTEGVAGGAFGAVRPLGEGEERGGAIVRDAALSALFGIPLGGLRGVVRGERRLRSDFERMEGGPPTADELGRRLEGPVGPNRRPLRPLARAEQRIRAGIFDDAPTVPPESPPPGPAGATPGDLPPGRGPEPDVPPEPPSASQAAEPPSAEPPVRPETGTAPEPKTWRGKQRQPSAEAQLEQLRRNLEGQRRQLAEAEARGEGDRYGFRETIARLERMIAEAEGRPVSRETPAPEPGAMPPAGPPERLHPTEPAAIEIDGQRFTGRDHFQAIQKAQAAGIDVEEGSVRAKSGYVTESGRFVDEREGLDLAKRAGQYRSDVPPSIDAEGREYLDSADLQEAAAGEKYPPGPRRQVPPNEHGYVERHPDALAPDEEIMRAAEGVPRGFTIPARLRPLADPELRGLERAEYASQARNLATALEDVRGMEAALKQPPAKKGQTGGITAKERARIRERLAEAQQEVGALEAAMRDAFGPEVLAHFRREFDAAAARGRIGAQFGSAWTIAARARLLMRRRLQARGVTDDQLLDQWAQAYEGGDKPKRRPVAGFDPETPGLEAVVEEARARLYQRAGMRRHSRYWEVLHSRHEEGGQIPVTADQARDLVLEAALSGSAGTRFRDPRVLWARLRLAGATDEQIGRVVDQLAIGADGNNLILPTVEGEQIGIRGRPWDPDPKKRKAILKTWQPTLESSSTDVAPIVLDRATLIREARRIFGIPEPGEPPRPAGGPSPRPPAPEPPRARSYDELTQEIEQLEDQLEAAGVDPVTWQIGTEAPGVPKALTDRLAALYEARDRVLRADDQREVSGALSGLSREARGGPLTEDDLRHVVQEIADLTRTAERSMGRAARFEEILQPVIENAHARLVARGEFPERAYSSGNYDPRVVEQLRAVFRDLGFTARSALPEGPPAAPPRPPWEQLTEQQAWQALDDDDRRIASRSQPGTDGIAPEILLVRVRELEGRTLGKRTRAELQAIYAELGELNARAGAGDLRSAIAKIRAALTRRMKKLPPDAAPPAEEPIDVTPTGRKPPPKGAARKAKIAEGRAARFAKAETPELLERYGEVLTRIQRQSGAHQWTRFDPNVQATRTGTRGNPRLADDLTLADALETELRARGVSEDDLAAALFEWQDRHPGAELSEEARRFRERQAFDEEVGERGGIQVERGDPSFNPDDLAMPRERDLFGNELPDDAPAQGGLFDERAGTAASRSTPEQLRALEAERDKLRVLIRGRLKESPSANARLAELDRILNRERAISADEMATRARAEEEPVTDADLEPPGQAELFTPATRPQGPDLFGQDDLDRFLEGSVVRERVYHGTAGDFHRFTRTEDLGFHFGTAEQASGKARQRGSPRLRARGPNVMPAYLSLRRPIRLKNDAGDFSATNWQFLKQLERAGVLSEAEAAEAFGRTFPVPDLEAYGRTTTSGPLRRTANTALRDLLESKGYDGIVYRNLYEGEGDSYLVFRPEQIKSATGNRGTFDPRSASILEAPARPEPDDPIVMAAVRDTDTDQIYRNTVHDLAHEDAVAAGADATALERGYVTRSGRFVPTEEARRTYGIHDSVNAGFGDELEAPRPRGRRARVEDVDRLTDDELDAALRYEEDLAARELELEARRSSTAAAPKPGEPSKSIEEMIALENELAAVEGKLKAVKSAKVRELLEAQLANRLRQQEAYVREWLQAGRFGELPEAVRGRFPGIDKQQPPPPPPPGGSGQGPHRQQSRNEGRERWQHRQEWERQQRERWRQERARRERERQERERARAQEREERERERARERAGRGSDRTRREERRREPPPPPPRRERPRPDASDMDPAPADLGRPRGAGEVLSRIRIARLFTQALDVGMRQGRFNAARRKARAVFKLQSEAIRTGRYDWLDAVSHEVGHFISKRYLRHPTLRGNRSPYQLTRAQLRELVKMGRDLYGSRKPGLGYAEEGIAQWGNFYVTDPARLAREAPEFSRFMETVVFRDHPLLRDAFDSTREHWRRWVGATPLERIKAQRAPKPSRWRAPKVIDVVRHWLDDLEPFRRLDKAAAALGTRTHLYELARLSRGAAGVADDWLKTGMIDVRDGRVLGRSVADMLAEVGTKRLDDFEAYLMAESALERWEAGINPGIMRADAEAVVRDLAPRFKRHAEVVWQHYNLLLQSLRDSGLLTPDAYAAILRRNKRHVAFYRLFEDYELPAGGKGRPRGMTPGHGVKRQHGSAREIISPLESIVKDTHEIASRLTRAKVARAMIEASQVEGIGKLVDEVPAPKEPVQIYAPDVLEQLRALGLVKVDPATGLPIKLEKDDLLGQVLLAFRERRTPGAAELKDLVVPITRNGVTRWFQILDRRLYDALEGLGPMGLPEWLRWAGKPVRTFRAGVTLTVRFILKNLVRDAATAMIRTRAGHRLIPGTDAFSFALPFEHFVNGFWAWTKKPELVHRWRQSGAENATLQGLDRVQTELAVRRLARQGSHTGRVVDIVRHPVDTIRMLGSIGENLTRLGEYVMVERQLLKRGLGPAAAQRIAGFAARDVTVDFAQAGSIGRSVNQLVAFFNAAVRSNANLLEDLARRPEVVLPRLLAGVTLPSLALYIAQRKDPEYQRTPRWIRDVAFVVIQRGDDRSEGWDGYGTGKVEHRWYIPKAFELGVLFGTVFERMAEWLEDQDPEAFDQLGKSLVQALTPSFLPPTAEVGLELATNRDRFRDRPIVPRSLEDVDARFQASPRTGETARAIGGAFPGQGVSPAKIEHAIRGHTGGLGGAVLEASDAAIRAFRAATGRPPLRDQATILRPDPEADPLTEIPGPSAFAGRDPMENAEDIERVYRRFEAAERKRQTWLYLLKEGRRQEAQEYLERHRAAIAAVATKEMTGTDYPGPLRGQYEAVTKLRRVGRAVPELRRPMVGRMHSIVQRLEEALK